jgi:hypothetical protein
VVDGQDHPVRHDAVNVVQGVHEDDWDTLDEFDNPKVYREGGNTPGVHAAIRDPMGSDFGTYDIEFEPVERTPEIIDAELAGPTPYGAPGRMELGDQTECHPRRPCRLAALEPARSAQCARPPAPTPDEQPPRPQRGQASWTSASGA